MGADEIRRGARDEDPSVRMVAVGNPSAPEDAIRLGAGGTTSEVRAAASVDRSGAPCGTTG
jgi:hypothetical protein